MVKLAGMSRQILFLCTGNYYRSRFAEYLFNHMAKNAGLNYTATSRALAIEMGVFNIGPVSIHTRKYLADLGIMLEDPIRHPMQCDEADLQSAFKVIAVKEAEHRPMLAERYPNWPDKAEYWNVHDLDQSTPIEALKEIESHVKQLIAKLTTVDAV